MRVIVSGMVAGNPGQGGATWAVLQYVLGLRRLGHEVWLVEPVDRLTKPRVAYFRRLVRAFGLETRAALLETGTSETVGLAYRVLREVARGADVLFNTAGTLRDEELVARVPARVYLDVDPAFTQLWHAEAGIDMRFAGHTHFVTLGQAVASQNCDVPTCGLDWMTTLPPVVLDRWPTADRLLLDAFTTVGNWRSYGSIERHGRLYGQRAHSVRELVELPTLTEERIVAALAIHPDERPDLEALAANGWELVDPGVVAATPAAYRAFVSGSKAELGLAKSGYVLSRCGWFSDRSACYLASGRPVVAQDTGFGGALPAGEGLIAFSSVEEALAGIESVHVRYERHRRAARAIAEDLLDSDKVLTRLLACL